MRSIKLLSLATMFAISTMSVSAQETKETIPVSGNCGMCKSKIEKAAKSAGATYANWVVDKKQLDVRYGKKTNAEKIQKAIAAVGYDTRDVKATNAAYDELHGCCKYERTEKMDCCEGDGDCCEDGKCTMDHEASKDAKMDCCKDGKCSKEGHKGKDCCKAKNE